MTQDKKYKKRSFAALDRKELLRRERERGLNNRKKGNK
jgi:hypothetical protein